MGLGIDGIAVYLSGVKGKWIVLVHVALVLFHCLDDNQQNVDGGWQQSQDRVFLFVFFGRKIRSSHPDERVRIWQPTIQFKDDNDNHDDRITDHYGASCNT